MNKASWNGLLLAGTGIACILTLGLSLKDPDTLPVLAGFVPLVVLSVHLGNANGAKEPTWWTKSIFLLGALFMLTIAFCIFCLSFASD